MVFTCCYEGFRNLLGMLSSESSVIGHERDEVRREGQLWELSPVLHMHQL